MTNLLTNCDSDKIDLGKRIEAASSIEEVVKLTDGYLSRLHRNMTDVYSLQKSRYAGNLLEILRYAVRTLHAVDKDVRMAEFQPSETRNGLVSKRFFVFGKTVQSALILVLLITLISFKVPWIPILLVVILLGTNIYQHVFEWRTLSVSTKTSGLNMQDEKPKIDVQLKIVHVHAYLNCIAEALFYVDKALNDQGAEKEGFLEKETQILKLFQDLFEAKAFHDGEWALKKIPHIRAILMAHGIVIKEYDPLNAADISLFDVEPCIDPSINSYVNIQPAFIKDKRVLLRGRVAEPFSTA